MQSALNLTNILPNLKTDACMKIGFNVALMKSYSQKREPIGSDFI